MLRYVIAAGSATLLMASAASAQDTQTAPATAAPTEAQTAPAEAAPTAPPAQDAAAPAPADKNAQVQQIVSADLPKYDADKSGDLNETEFSTWVLELRSKSEAGSPDAAKTDAAAKAKWAKEAFAQADTDKDQKLAQSEVVAFFAAAT